MVVVATTSDIVYLLNGMTRKLLLTNCQQHFPFCHQLLKLWLFIVSPKCAASVAADSGLRVEVLGKNFGPSSTMVLVVFVCMFVPLEN